MNPLYSVTEFGEIAAGNASIQAIEAALVAATEANQVAASALTPPGLEGASTRAVMQQMSSIEQFHAMLALGLEQLEERIISTSIFAETGEATEAFNEASAAVGAIGGIAGSLL